MKNGHLNRREFLAAIAVAGGVLLQPDWVAPLLAAEVPGAVSPDDKAVKTVYLVWKCHLDIGFTAPAREVIRKYFEVYLPQAMALGEEIGRAGRGERFTWTTGSWLIDAYLESAAPADRARMERAIGRGNIAWHALPHSFQSELMSRDLLASSLQISRDLDRRFGKQTTGAKMTDVPGHSIGIVAPLAAAGVTFLDIGTNPGSATPQTPPLFRWRDADGAEICVLNHPDYGTTLTVPNSDFAVCIGVWGDNGGVPSLEQFRAYLAGLQSRFPGARVKMSSLSDVAHAIDAVRAQLPVVTSEIGDTWIHGAASDPLLLARFRELDRLHSKWLREGQIQSGDATDLAFVRRLSLVPEHTWGLDIKTFLKSYDVYGRAELDAARPRPNFRKVEASWAEKRARIEETLAVLPTTLQTEAALQLQSLIPAPPSRRDLNLVLPGEVFETRHFLARIDTRSGALTQLQAKNGGRDWAGATHPLGLIVYQTFEAEDFARFIRAYSPISRESWVLADFGKPGLEKTGARQRTRLARLRESRIGRTRDGWRVTSEIGIAPLDEKPENEGPPRRFTLEMLFPDASPEVQITLQWFDKPAYRKPEALWFSFVPRAPDDAGWTLDKIGQWVSPLDVVAGGNRQMHAIGRGVSYRDAQGGLQIDSLDAPLVAVGERSLLNFSARQPDLQSGMHFNLFNNVWGTNYRMWFEDNMKFRFTLRV